MGAIDRGRIPPSMETCVSNSDGNKVVLRDGINHVCVGIADSRARSQADLRTSTGKIGFHSVVKITPAELVTRLGTGRHRWFSASLHVPICSITEFRFQGSTDLLVLYHVRTGQRRESSSSALASTR